MNFWKQLPLGTKIYLAIMASLVVMLAIMMIVRFSQQDNGWSLKETFLQAWMGRPSATPTPALPPTPLPTPTFPPGSPLLRALDFTPIREKPDEDSQGLALLEKNQLAQVIGVSSDHKWWAIRVPYVSGGQGWVAANQTVTQGAVDVPILDAKGQPASAGTPSDETPVVQAVSNLNIRSGPDMSFNSVGVLKYGQVAEVLGISADGLWWAIKVPGKADKVGWVSKDYVAPRNTIGVPVITVEPSALGTIVPTPVSGAAYLVTAYVVNIRAGPGKEYEVIGKLEQGQVAEVVGKSEDGEWWAITYPASKTGKGWVAAAFVQVVGGEKVPVVK
jgi:uncharacterized protein YgiM (DUF1202 family)